VNVSYNPFTGKPIVSRNPLFIYDCTNGFRTKVGKQYVPRIVMSLSHNTNVIGVIASLLALRLPMVSAFSPTDFDVSVGCLESTL